MRSVITAGAAAAAAAVLAVSISCGGSSYGGGNPSGPSTPPPPPPSNAATIQIVGSAGAQAFNPNPSSLPSSRAVAWRNEDSTIHRIVANDGSFDTGNIAPGATSTAVTLPTAGVRYHCTLHPTMVGAVNDSGGATPPCSGLYC